MIEKTMIEKTMKTTLHTLGKISLLLITAATFSACGQKGPLEIDQPIQTQEKEEEQAPTI